jgi:protein-disulfide isomerase
MNAPNLRLPVSKRDHIQGRSDASVTLVEYGDYECPHCGRAYGIIKKIQETLGDQMRFVFRNFPLRQLHPHAEIAALAAEAAGSQGKFWEMHDMLYENRTALDSESLASYAAKLGLDTKRFIEEINQKKHADRIIEDRRSGLRSGVNGTPTFYINDIRYDGSLDFEPLLNAIQTEINRGQRKAG